LVAIVAARACEAAVPIMRRRAASSGRKRHKTRETDARRLVDVVDAQREFVAGLGSAVAWPAVARAQQDQRMRRIGVLLPYHENDPLAKARISAFTQALNLATIPAEDPEDV
jgi:hypothetical protein